MTTNSLKSKFVLPAVAALFFTVAAAPIASAAVTAPPVATTSTSDQLSTLNQSVAQQQYVDAKLAQLMAPSSSITEGNAPGMEPIHNDDND